MPTETPQSALEREHREIDRELETFIAEAGDEGFATAPVIEAIEALRRHIYLEEEFLFPPLRVGGMTMPIFVMLREHGEIWQTMDTITALIDERADVQRLRDACSGLLSQLDQHNGKEEAVVYPQAATLTAEAAAELTEFIVSGQTPKGWICEQAQS